MTRLPSTNLPAWRTRWLAPMVVVLTLAIFGAAIFLVTEELRRQIRHQMIMGDAALLPAVIMLQYTNDLQTTPGLSMEEPAEQFALLLKTSRLRGVVAARLFDAQGRFVASCPQNVAPAQLSIDDSLAKAECSARFYQAADLSRLFVAEAKQPKQLVPLLEVNVPLTPPNDTRLLGVAQFFQDGGELSQEFDLLDDNLFWQATLVFVLAGGLTVAGLWWAFRRLQRANAELSERTASLAQANQELALAAKTSAVGAISAHLIHGLRSPLSGLHNLLAGRVAQPGTTGPELEMALEATRQIRQMVANLNAMILNEGELPGAPISLAGALGTMAAKLRPAGEAANVGLAIKIETDALIPSRTAHLAGLILENLLRNAIQATAAGKGVSLTVRAHEQSVQCEVADQGEGFPESRLANPFTPCQSRKPGGLGIGLAISKQLANHLGAGLELVSSSSTGCVFRLTLPVRPEPLGEAGAKNSLAMALVLN